MTRPLPSRHFRRTHLTALALAVGLAGATTAGPADAATTAPAATAQAAPLSITVHPDQLGNELHPGFVGLSFGAATIAQDDYASTDLVDYLRTLGRTTPWSAPARPG